jgi:hypothetical protein
MRTTKREKWLLAAFTRRERDLLLRALDSHRRTLQGDIEATEIDRLVAKLVDRQ